MSLKISRACHSSNLLYYSIYLKFKPAPGTNTTTPSNEMFSGVNVTAGGQFEKEGLYSSADKLAQSGQTPVSVQSLKL